MRTSTSNVHTGILDALKELSSQLPASNVFRYLKGIYNIQYQDAISYLASICTRCIFSF